MTGESTESGIGEIIISAAKTAIENNKVKVSIMPDEFTIKGLANKMIEFYRKLEK